MIQGSFAQEHKERCVCMPMRMSKSAFYGITHERTLNARTRTACASMPTHACAQHAQGTLITQDVFVGVFFAVGPLFARSSMRKGGEWSDCSSIGHCMP